MCYPMCTGLVFGKGDAQRTSIVNQNQLMLRPQLVPSIPFYEKTDACKPIKIGLKEPFNRKFVVH